MAFVAKVTQITLPLSPYTHLTVLSCSHIRREPPTEDTVMQNLTPPWKAVCYLSLFYHSA